MPCCLFYCLLAFQRDRKPFQRVIAFRISSPIKERVKAKHSILDWLPLKAKKHTRSMPAAPIPPQNYSPGSRAPVQLNSKPNSSPQRTLQSCKSKKASHPGWEIMLLGPTVDTFKVRADCRANKLTLTRGRECTIQDRPCTLLHGPIGRFLYRPPTEGSA